MANYWIVLFFSLIGGVFSLWGGLLLLSHKKTAKALARFATPFAAGALLAATFFDLLPESLHQISGEAAARWVLVGIVLFFLLEHFVHWFHHHHEHEGEITPAPLVVIGDSLHNLLDGIAIGAAFLIDAPTGIVTAIAVAAHEIPQEIGDFGLLLKFGYSRRKVIIINILSALTATIGALVTFWIGSEANLPIGALLAITAGLFIYIASSDLIPTIHEESKRKATHIAAALLLLGILVVGITTAVAHKYIDVGHDHEMSETAEHAHEEGDKAHDHAEGFEITSHDHLPTVSVELEEDSLGGYNVFIHATDFEFTPDEVGHKAEAGEGHAHIYINGEKWGRVYAEAVHIPTLKEGDEVRVTLNANDHREFTHDGLPIQAELVVGEMSHGEHSNEDEAEHH